MKFLAVALLALTGFVHAVPPVVSALKYKQTGANFECSVTVNPGGENTDLRITWVAPGVPLEKRDDTTIPVSNVDEVRAFNLAGLQGGKTYTLRVEAYHPRAVTIQNPDPFVPLDPPEFEELPLVVKPYSEITIRPPVVTAPTKGGDPLTVKLAAKVVASGGDIESVVFEYGTVAGEYPNKPAGKAGTGADSAIYSATITDSANTPLKRGTVYHYRVVVITSGGDEPSTTDDSTFTTPENRAPVAKPDEVKLVGDRAALIDVLKNDSDPDGDGLKLVSVTQGKQGRVEIVGNQIRYTPIDDADDGDSFSYTVKDDYDDGDDTTKNDSRSATTTVTINAPGLRSRGLHAAEIKDADGNVVGLIRLTGTGDGTVTGKIQLFTQRYTVMGQIDANGRFYYTIPRDENGPLQLTVDFSDAGDAGGDDDDGGGFDVTVEGDGKFWTGEEVPNTLTDTRRDQLVGKYTVELPAPGGDDQPKGTGFVRLDIKPWGEVSIKGRLGDGSKFSTTGVLTGSDSNPIVSMFTTPGDTRLRANFQFNSGDANLSGPFVWFREADSDAMFPNGIYGEIDMNGSRLTPAEKGRRTLTDAKKATITLTDGNLRTTITQSIEISKSDRVSILGSNPFGVTLKIDRDNGTFKGQFDHPFDDSRRKFLGVLLQAQEKGSGVFTGVDQTGAVSLSIGISEPPPAPRPPPTPTPAPTAVRR